MTKVGFTDLHTIQVSPKDSAKPLTGSNCQITIDGNPVKGCTKFSFEISATGVAKATIELLANASIDGYTELSEKII